MTYVVSEMTRVVTSLFPRKNGGDFCPFFLLASLEKKTFLIPLGLIVC